jgi:hypothetical protein
LKDEGKIAVTMTFGGGKKDTEQSVQPSKPNLQAYLSQL